MPRNKRIGSVRIDGKVYKIFKLPCGNEYFIYDGMLVEPVWWEGQYEPSAALSGMGLVGRPDEWWRRAPDEWWRRADVRLFTNRQKAACRKLTLQLWQHIGKQLGYEISG